MKRVFIPLAALVLLSAAPVFAGETGGCCKKEKPSCCAPGTEKKEASKDAPSQEQKAPDKEAKK